MTRIPQKIVFVFPYRLTAGGMPDDTRQFVTAVSHAHDGDVLLLSQGTPDDDSGQLSRVSLVDLDGHGATEHVFDTLTPNDITVFITFSSLINVRLAKGLRARGLRYTVLPAWQVHEFLDWDRPFAKKTVPTILTSEVDSSAFNNRGQGGVVEGRRTLRAFFRSLKRKLFRRTLGKSFLQNACSIHVFSSYEKNQIVRLMDIKGPNFCEVSFGVDLDGRDIGKDTFPDSEGKNIVFWGRADFFYKGLDLILDAVALAKSKGISTPFTIFFCGPDYNDGHRKLIEHSELKGVRELIRIVAPGQYIPGTIGLLASADFCIMASRWDGFSRTLRESCVLGVPVISNRQSHFDIIASLFGNCLIFDSVEELANIFSDLDECIVTNAQNHAQRNLQQISKFLSWSECARRFVRSIENLADIRE